MSHPYPDTIATKEARLSGHFDKLSLLPTSPVQTLPATRISGWRARARMLVNHQATSAKDVLGFYAAGSREIVPIEACQAHRPVIEQALAQLRDALFASQALLKMTRFVEARSLDDTHVSLILCLRKEPEVRQCIDLLGAMHMAFFAEHTHVTLGLRLGGKGASIGSGETIYPLNDTPPTETFELANSRTLTLPPGSFFQQHPEQLLAAHELMKSWLGDSPQTLIDLYSGVGAHGLALIAEGGTLLGMDSDDAAITALQHNIDQNQDIHGQALAAPDDQAIAWFETHYTGDQVIVVNPARAGLHHSVTAWLSDKKPARVLYMSCNEHTLGRDLVRLARHGMRVNALAMLDMMPFAHQLEALAMISPGEIIAPTDTDGWQGAFLGEERAWSQGISGVTARGDHAVWYAVVSGKAPRHGRLPFRREASAEITCERLFTLDRFSGLRIRTEGLIQDSELRERLRAWGYAVVGDKDYGYKKVNRSARIKLQLDRLLLHCVSHGQADTHQPSVMPLDQDWPVQFQELFAQAIEQEKREQLD